MLEVVHDFLIGPFFRSISIGIVAGGLINNLILFLAHIFSDNFNVPDSVDIIMIRNAAVKRFMWVTVICCALLGGMIF